MTTTDPWALGSPAHVSLQHFPPRRSELIGEAVDKPIRRFRQWDAFVPVADHVNDYVTGPQDDGTPSVHTGEVWELRRGTPVRVQAEAGISRADVIAGLRAILRSIESDTRDECPACGNMHSRDMCGPSVDCICDWIGQP